MKIYINMTCLIGKEEIHKIFNNFSVNYPEYASYMSGMYHKANDGYDTFEWSGELPEESYTEDLIRLTTMRKAFMMKPAPNTYMWKSALMENGTEKIRHLQTSPF